MMKKKIIIAIFIFLSSIGTAMAALSIEDEQKKGREFYEALEKSALLYRDQRVTTYVTQLGNRILANMPPQPFAYRFSVIKSSAINAFATPGGYIYVNMGLVSLAENEGELAGVLSHEIAHVASRHIADIFEKSQKVTMATLAAVMAGALLGGGGELTAAATGFSLAAGTTLMLKYSREHEEEADRQGMAYLVKAGYDGQGMPDFLKSMRQYEYYSSKIPSYFLTHPGTEERIRYLDALLQTRYRKGGSQNILGQLKRVQTVLTLEQKDPDANQKFFQSELAKSPNNVEYLYGLAVTQDRLGLTSKAIATFQKALTLAPDDPDVLRDLGIAFFKTGRSAEAIPYLSKALGKDDEGLTTAYYLGKAYEAVEKYATAIEIYQQLIKKEGADDEVFHSLAAAYGKTNKRGISHYYFGLYFKKKNKLESALFHFKEALKHLPPGSGEFKETENHLQTMKLPDREYPPHLRKQRWD